MRSTRGVLAIAGAALLALTACASDKTPELMNLRASGNGPDEFGILPPKALELPEDLTALPEPTPGGVNLSDRDPMADALIALGGAPRRAGSVGGADGALVNHAARHGATPNIRATLAAEDLDFRRKNNGRLLERAFNVNVYFKAYKRMALDQFAELERWRKAGARTPSAPPQKLGE